MEFTYHTLRLEPKPPLYKALPYDFSISFVNLFDITGLANFIAGVNNPLSGDLNISYLLTREKRYTHHSSGVRTISFKTSFLCNLFLFPTANNCSRMNALTVSLFAHTSGELSWGMPFILS
jgi:hypothetical protein